jgi:hypothetical protein
MGRNKRKETAGPGAGPRDLASRVNQFLGIETEEKKQSGRSKGGTPDFVRNILSNKQLSPYSPPVRISVQYPEAQPITYNVYQTLYATFYPAISYPLIRPS